MSCWIGGGVLERDPRVSLVVAEVHADLCSRLKRSTPSYTILLFLYQLSYLQMMSTGRRRKAI